MASTAGAIPATVRICERSPHTHVVTEAANLLLALAWRNTGNKVRVASGGSCEVLLRRVIYHASLHDHGTSALNDTHTHCFERCCMALASLMLYPPNHEHILKGHGLADLINIAKETSDKSRLVATVMVIVCLVPSPDEIRRCHDDECEVPGEWLLIPIYTTAHVALYMFSL